MLQLILPTSEIYPYLFDVDRLDIEQWKRLAGAEYDFMKAPPIPIYTIPKELQRNSWKYMLPDGNHRWLCGHVTAGRVYAILLQPEERILIEEWGMAPFRHASDPALYQKTLGIYCYQENIK